MTKARDISSLIGSSGQIDNAKITLDVNEIPALDTAKITTGTLSADRIDNTSLSNVTALPFSAGTDWQSTIVTGSTLTAVAGKGYWINTTSNACTITLPASASVGDFIEFSDYARNWGTNAVTINTNSLNFQGNTSPNPEYNTNGQSVKLIYSGATQGWIPTVDDNVTLETPQPYSIDFLVIAGGGGGGDSNGGGGGGAGGYRNSFSTETSGGGGSSEASPNFSTGTVYTVTVGAGGAGSSTSAKGVNGVDSSISGSGFATITSTGGGGGGSNVSTNKVGVTGGSGGGGSRDANTSSQGLGTANQGYNGGSAVATSAASGGGGGGAGAVGYDGKNADGSGNNYALPSTFSQGGAGLASSITGSSVTRAGGGGAAYENSSGAGQQPQGGSGGGGKGATSVGTINASTAGTANTGSGGGGGQPNGSSGGKGVVILRIPTANYSGTTTGSPTVTTDGTDKVIVFNDSGSITG
jgi:hypothetical protein